MNNINTLKQFFNQYLEKNKIDTLDDDVIRDAFFSYSENSSGNKADIDNLILLQNGYRDEYGWDHNFNHIIQAGGYLIDKYDSLADYVFEKIISNEPDDIDFKYFLIFCLTNAAETNPYSTGLLWKLMVLAWPEDLEEGKNSPYFTHDANIDISSDTTHGLKDCWRSFSVATPEVY